MSKYKVIRPVQPSGGGEECEVGDEIELTDAEALSRQGKVESVRKLKAPKKKKSEEE